MLELPEAYARAGQVREFMLGKRVRDIVINASPHKFAWFLGEPDDYHALLNGVVIDGARSVGGQIEVMAGDVRMLFNDGVNLRLLSPEEKRPAKHQLMLNFEDDTSLVCSVQMYGGMCCFHDGQNDENGYYRVACDKPSPITDAFDRAYFMDMVSAQKKNLSLKALLATEQRIPGLGNGVLQDILFTAGFGHRRKLETMDAAGLDTLFDSVKSTLTAMAMQGGRDTERDLFGVNGGYTTILSRLTADKPCPRCGAAIVKEPYLGGSVYYCPVCQK